MSKIVSNLTAVGVIAVAGLFIFSDFESGGSHRHLADVDSRAKRTIVSLIVVHWNQALLFADSDLIRSTLDSVQRNLY